MRKFIYVKTYKRGATWNDGDPRMCVRCGVEVSHGERWRRNRATVTAVDVTGDTQLNVAYCEEHVPKEIQEKLNG